ncbi:MAG: hypothetical protein FJY99_03640 [Candidatus Sericytochromatia bacterium]|nr:hypothetical protein [Candidatus Tanganyikabacteria bacterium]
MSAWQEAPAGTERLASAWADPGFPYRLAGSGWIWSDGQSSAGLTVRQARHDGERLIRLGILRDVTGTLPTEALLAHARALGLDAIACETAVGAAVPTSGDTRAWQALGNVLQIRRLPLWRTLHVPGHKVHRIGEQDTQALAMHLEQYRTGLALAPTSSPEQFLEGLALCPGLTLDHFRIVRRDGTLVALAGLWAPGGFHLSTAPGPGAMSRLALGAAGLLGRRSPWPTARPGAAGPVGHVRVLACKPGQWDAVALLLSGLAGELRRWGLQQLGINLREGDPLLGLLPGGPGASRKRTVWYLGVSEGASEAPTTPLDPNLVDPW